MTSGLQIRAWHQQYGHWIMPVQLPDRWASWDRIELWDETTSRLVTSLTRGQVDEWYGPLMTAIADLRAALEKVNEPATPPPGPMDRVSKLLEAHGL